MLKFCFTKGLGCVFLVSVLLISFLGISLYFAPSVAGLGQSSSSTLLFNGEKDDGLNSLVKASDNGFAMAGYTRSYGAEGSDMWLVRTAQHLWGTSCYYQMYYWNKTYGGAGDDVAKCIIQTSDGGFALAGYTNSSGAGGFDMWLVKTDLQGNALWNVTYGGPQDDVANSLVQTSDGGYVLVGYTNQSSETSGESWVVKVDASGTARWNQTCAGIYAVSVVKSNDDAIVFAVDYTDAIGLVKIDLSGAILVNQTLASDSSFVSPESLTKTSDGGYALAGTLNISSGIHDGWLIRTDSLGNKVFNCNYNGTGIYSVTQTTDGGYALTGDYATMIITDAQGNILWSQINDALSSEYRQRIHTATHSIIQYGDLQYAMVGEQESYGSYDRGYGAFLNMETLKTDTTPPAIQIYSPANGGLYSTEGIPLVVYVDNSASRLWYALDGQGNNTLTGNITLPTLTEGQHNITVYAQDTSYNTGASDTVPFLTQTAIFDVSANAGVSHPTVPTSTYKPKTGIDLQMGLWTALAVIIAVIVCVALVFYKISTPKTLTATK